MCCRHAPFCMPSARKSPDKRLFEHASLTSLSRGKAAAIEVECLTRRFHASLFVLLSSALYKRCLAVRNFARLKKWMSALSDCFFDQAPKVELPAFFEL